MNSFYSPFGPFGPMGGYGSPFGYSGHGNGLYSPYYGTPAKTSNSLLVGAMFSNFGADSTLGGLFEGSLFKAKEYGTPPTENITNALVGRKLAYNTSFMGAPLQFEIDQSDIGAISGTQYNGADAWKARVGQQGVFWDVILDEAGNEVLKVSQV
jgi:hypothetical protein